MSRFLKFSPIGCCIFIKKETCESLWNRLEVLLNYLGCRAINKICPDMTRFVMTYIKEIKKWTNILTNKLIFYFFNFF